MQEYNSKSHFIIILTLFHYYKIKNIMKISKLFLVDLEGSERLSKVNIPEEEPLEEQKLINKSLIALSIIVQNLSNKNDNINYAPYRDSKLTRIISDSFGGNCYTSLILTCSKHEHSTIETRNTLMFGEKAKQIKNYPKINIENQNQDNILMEIFLGNEENENINDNKDNTYSYKKTNNINNMNLNINNNKINKNEIENNNRDIYDDSQLNIENLFDTEMKFLKIQLRQLKEKIEQDKLEMNELKERNNILENENKNLMYEFEKLFNEKKKEENVDKLNSEYIIQNINDLHELLNKKENNEKNLKQEIYSLKLLLEKKNLEFNDIINEKNREINKIKNSGNSQNLQIFQEFTECLDQASNQLDNKDKKIEELLNIINNLQKKK